MPLEYEDVLDFAQHGNVLLYGPPKTGKTAGAATVPGETVHHLNLDLPNATLYARQQQGSRFKSIKFQGFQTLIDLSVAADAGELPAVVVDPIGDLHRLLMEEVSNRAVRPTLSQYGDVATHLERWCRHMCEAPTNFVIVAHDNPVQDEGTGTVDRWPYTGTNKPTLGRKLTGMVDIVGYTGVVEDDQGQVQYMAQLIPANGRSGGDRFATLGKIENLNLTDWFERAGVGVSANANNNETKDKDK